MINMINKLKILFIIITAIIFSLAGCQQAVKNSMKTGTWSDDGRVFTNEWSNLCVTIPEGYRSLSPEEIQEVAGFGEDIMVNNGGMSKQSYNFSKMRTVYDFIITTETGIPNYILMYENIALQSIIGNLDEEGYLNEVEKTLQKIDVLTYTNIGTSIKKLAGDDWLVGTFSLADGAAYQDYYLKKTGKIMIVFVVTYTDTEIVDTFIGAITKAK